MSILTNRSSAGHLAEAAVHFNRAVEALAAGRPNVDIARALFDGLNKVQSEWRLGQPPGETLGEVKAFTSMILSELQPEAREVFLCSPELQVLTELQPQIMDHSVLNRNGYRPDTAINSRLLSDATRQHRRLRASFSELRAANDPGLEDRVIKRNGELLYVVRSNIAHGEKSPDGPDLNKTARDESVSAIVVPLLRLLFELIFERPSQKLAVYGTLAPGEVNYHILEHIPGRWQDCRLRGVVERTSGLPTLLWKPHGNELKAKLFESAELVTHWERLDSFEGAGYKRWIVPVTIESGIAIANVYVRA
jgi:gamma-glutamylcyclotransferase (GGCT)/AIG2-like uncharacterized protein YtfP